MEEVKKNKGGRPPKDIDEKLLYRLSQTLLTNESIATILECSPDTLERRFCGLMRKAREDRKATLSEAMWDKALVEKNTVMQIWLSKQHLGHRDKQPDEIDTNVVYNVNVKEIPK
jgi:hypothetical protein